MKTKDFTSAEMFNKLMSQYSEENLEFITISSEEIRNCNIALSNYYHKDFYKYIGFLHKSTEMTNSYPKSFKVLKSKINKEIIEYSRLYYKTHQSFYLVEGKKLFEAINGISKNVNSNIKDITMKFVVSSIQFKNDLIYFTVNSDDFSFELSEKKFICLIGEEDYEKLNIKGFVDYSFSASILKLLSIK